MEENTKKYIQIQGDNGEIEIYDVQQFPFKPILKFEGDSQALTKIEGACKQKEEYIAVNAETKTKSEDVDGLELNIEYAEIDINSDPDDYESFQTSLFLPESQGSGSEELLFQCEMCPFNTKCKKELKKHILSHTDVTTIKFHTAEIHVLSLDNPAETTMYRCQKCSYESEDKDNVIAHMGVHQNATYQSDSSSLENPTYTCDNCSFQTNVKKDLRRHMIVHKDNSEVTLYKCDTCSFQTRHKNNLNSHNMRSHKDASEIKMHECDSCSFTTKYKRNMERHKATHKAVPLEYLTFKVALYKCEFCRYETRHKHYLKTHMLKHKLPSELTVHQCDVCSYKTTRGKERLRQHMIVHKDASEVATYTCESCPFNSKYKNSYERHMLTHMNPSETPMYRCIRFSTCSFQTKHKNNLKAHNMRFHRDALEGVADDH